MNLFVVIENEKGETELITPPLEDLILPGVTRDRCVVWLALRWAVTIG